MKKWLMEKLVYGYLKGVLDKLPFNNYKTALCILVYAINVAIPLLPQYAPILQPVADFLQPYSGGIETLSLTGTITFLVHKVIKFFDKKKNG